MKARSTSCKLAVLFVCALLLSLLLPAFSALAEDTFSITYKTNAGVTMGTVSYTVGEATNNFPDVSAFSVHFNAFLQRAVQRGTVAIAPESTRWYSDSGLTQVATFPQGSAGENYTIYCRFTTGLSVTSVSNGAENKSYSEVEGLFQPNLGVSYNTTNSRSDQYMATIAVFEKNVNGTWVEVDESYRTDYRHNVWPNTIWFSNVSDSGTYRLKYLRYTTTDIDGNVLYYEDAYDNGGTYEVKITPVELTITGVQAENRPFNGTPTVTLSGGTLNGVLFGDDVSFVLGTGTVAASGVGTGIPVTTNILLTGSKAGNYTLIQPSDVTVNITQAPSTGGDDPTWDDGSYLEEPTSVSQANAGAALPKTGDESGITLWAAMLLLSCAGMACAFNSLKKRSAPHRS